MLKLARFITRAIDCVHNTGVLKRIPAEMFRYAVCGGFNIVLGWCVYAFLYRMVFAGRYLDFGFVVISPHISAFLIQFVITFLTGFWLNRYVTFTLSSLSGRTQILRYAMQVSGALLLNYVLLKILVEAAGMYPVAARPVTDSVVVAYSYLTARFFTFRTSRSAVSAKGAAPDSDK